MVKKKTSYLQRKKKDDSINIKALIWVGAAVAVLIIALSLLIIFD